MIAEKTEYSRECLQEEDNTEENRLRWELNSNDLAVPPVGLVYTVALGSNSPEAELAFSIHPDWTSPSTLHWNKVNFMEMPAGPLFNSNIVMGQFDPKPTQVPSSHLWPFSRAQQRTRC